MPNSKPEIEGYPQFQSALDDIERDLPKRLKDAANQVARDWISAARNKASGSQAREAAGAMGVRPDSEGAVLTNSHPLFYGEEFGGQARPETMQFPPYQGQRGYWLFPAARESATAFQKVWEAAIDKATEAWDHRE